MTLERSIVTVSGTLMVLIGIAYGLAPTLVAGQAGLSATSSGLTDLRAVYGGVQFGLGCFLLWCARDPPRFRAGLTALGIVFVCVGLFRVLGLLVDRAPTYFHVANLAVEISVAALVTGVLARAAAPRS